MLVQNISLNMKWNHLKNCRIIQSYLQIVVIKYMNKFLVLQIGSYIFRNRMVAFQLKYRHFQPICTIDQVQCYDTQCQPEKMKSFVRFGLK